ncbi:MAG TPA: hypothetical protein GX505_07915 [Clostridiales bacterium]|nr:hypothetical protein [Clostridiales bacterium]
MKMHSRIIVVLLLTILLCISGQSIIYANSAEPPGFTVIVSNPPDDLSLSLLLPGGSQSDAIVLPKEQKAWETYYRFFYHLSPSRDFNLADAVLIVESSEQSFECPIPGDTFKEYNNLLTLDLNTKTLKIGQSPLRVPILVALRVVLTLHIESAVFFLFGYREKRSWMAFLAINIITQTFLNAMLTGPGISSYWMFGYIFMEILIIIAEMIAFTSIVKEHKRFRTAMYTIAANLASLILGGLLITYLPV